MKNIIRMTTALIVFGGLLVNMFAAIVGTMQYAHGDWRDNYSPLWRDSRYMNALKGAGINFFQRLIQAEIHSMSHTGVFAVTNETSALQEQLINFYKNNMQTTVTIWGPHLRNWKYNWGFYYGAPYDSLIYDNNGNVIGLVPELDTIQEYCDFWLENYTKPMIKGRYEQGMYIFCIGQEDYWLEPEYTNNPAHTLSSFFPLHDYHEFDGLSLEEKEKRMRETVAKTYKKLYEWKNENYPKIILMHTPAYSHTDGTNGTMLKTIRDIPWVDWFGINGGGADPMVGSNELGPGPGKKGKYQGMGSHYPVFKQMIETNYFEYLNADGVMEQRQSRGWGIGNTETGWAAEAPGTPEEFLKLPEQYSDTRYYDDKIHVGESTAWYPGQTVFQKYMSEWSALDKGNNYIKYHSLLRAFPQGGQIADWHTLYPTTFMDGDLPAGERYFTDEEIDERMEKEGIAGKLYVDNFVLTENGALISQEGDFETIPSSVWARREAFVSHADGLGVDNGRGMMCSNGCLIASQICGSQPGHTRMDFSIMAKGIPIFSGFNPLLGIYWESYDSSGNILEKGKALSDSSGDGKFWHIPLTNTYQTYSGYILKNNPNAEYIKISIYNAFPVSRANPYKGTALMPAAYCFNGPYGHDETDATFTFWNKITKSNETTSTSKYKFIRDEMHTPGGKLYDIWGGLQWPLAINKGNIAYNPDNGQITITLRNMCASNPLSAPIHIFRRDKGAGPAWNTNLYVKATPANIDSSLVLADRIAYVALNSYSVPGPTLSTDNPLTSSDNTLVRVVNPTNTVANGQRIYVYIQDTESVKGWTAFNDLPECSGALQEGTNSQIKITINSADEDGVKSTELEYSINNEDTWYPLDSSSSTNLESYYDLGGAPYLIKFRARAVDVHDLSSNWIYLDYYYHHLTEIYVDPNSSSTNYEAGTTDAPFRSIQDAIDIAEPGVKVFHLNKGIYNENLVLKDGNELIGASADIVKITGLVSLNSMSNALLKNIMFTGANGVKLASAKNVRIKNCIFAVQNIGIEITGTSVATNENITVGKAQQAISVTDSSALDITHSIITASNGIARTGSATCTSTYNNVFCSNQNYSGTSAGTGCISTNPLYISDGNYSLKERSPCWTAGYLQLSIGWQRINLVENSGLELGTLEAWQSMYNSVHREISSVAMSGNYSLKVTTPGVNRLEGIGSSVNYQVEKGKTYTASAYVRTDRYQKGRIKLCLYAGPGKWTYANEVTVLNDQWQKISVTRTITEPGEALTIFLMTWAWSYEGPQAITMYVDNIELMEVQDYKMVYNGGFELGTLKAWQSMYYSVYGEISSEAMAGDYSLKVITPGVNRLEGIGSSVNYQVEKGKTYTASAYVKTDPSQSGRIKICLYAGPGKWTYANEVTVLNDQWQKISVTRTITEPGEALTIFLMTWAWSYEGPQAITMYVDEIALEENNDIGYWKLDEGGGTTAHDSSWRGNNGTLQGNPQWVGGQINSALSFNGSNYVDCGRNDSFKVSAITMEAWVYSPTTNFSGYNEIAGAEGAYGCLIYNNKIAVHINTVNEGWHWCESSTALTWGGWHHVAFTYDGVSTVKCYRDGVLILTDTTSSSGKLQWGCPEWTAPKLYIGQVNPGRKLFKGMIDEVRIYNRPLSAREIKNHWQDQQDQDVGYWKLDDGAGTTAQDSSWRGNNGTLQGNPQWVGGQINSALSFNGSNYVDCGTTVRLKNPVNTAVLMVADL